MHLKHISRSFNRFLQKQMKKEHPEFHKKKKRSRSRSRDRHGRRHGRDRHSRDSRRDRDHRKKPESAEDRKMMNSEERRKQIAQWNEESASEGEEPAAGTGKPEEMSEVAKAFLA